MAAVAPHGDQQRNRRRFFDKFMLDSDAPLRLDNDELRQRFISAMLEYGDLQDLAWRMASPEEQGPRRIRETVRHAVDGGSVTTERFTLPLLKALLGTGSAQLASTGSRNRALSEILLPVRSSPLRCQPIRLAHLALCQLCLPPHTRSCASALYCQISD